MQDALNTLVQAHQQMKNVAIQSIQNDQEIEQHVIDSIKSVHALIQAIRVAIGA